MGLNLFWSRSLLLVIALSVAESSLVSLSHGGKLFGRRSKFNGTIVEQFFGVRYAQAPVGNLRFKKPEPIAPWRGIRSAGRLGNVCPQLDTFGPEVKQLGSEDCLFLDITVPGGVRRSRNKPVMIWIHGGGYVIGSKDPYIGSVLALHGDVIVVTINYRLGALGFLSNGPGTGNFGLWDQRAAILWVKENIRAFGGDPNKITIFGESAGGGSVVAQMMGKLNGGLFQRGIAQSGSLYLPWSWYLSSNEQQEVVTNLKGKRNCGEYVSVYDCYKNASITEILTNTVQPTFLGVPWHPTPDNDFFPTNINEEKYELTRRFDLLAGFNGQEGGVFILLDLITFIASRNSTINNGISLALAREYVTRTCAVLVSETQKNYCASFVIRNYDIDRVTTGRARVIKISNFLSDFLFVSDILNLLEKHNTSSRSNYGYLLKDWIRVPSEIASILGYAPWQKQAAFHGDDLHYVFGLASVTDKMFKPYKDVEDQFITFKDVARNYSTAEDRELANDIMTFWTNFAKTGNPNAPKRPSPNSTPYWPEFTVANQKLMELGYQNRVITTPNKQRIDRLIETILPIRKQRVEQDSRQQG